MPQLEWERSERKKKRKRKYALKIQRKPRQWPVTSSRYARKWHKSHRSLGREPANHGVIRSKQKHTRLERDATDLRWAGLQATTRNPVQCSARRDLSSRGVLGTWMFTLVRIGGSSVGPVAPRTQRTFYSLAWPAMDVEIPPSSRRVAARRQNTTKPALLITAGVAGSICIRRRLRRFPNPTKRGGKKETGSLNERRDSITVRSNWSRNTESRKRSPDLSICRYACTFL